ncbi:PopZ family protein [Cohaesibacter celericrescens]|uniref:DUF2497 domain-containing protein n=1 Tax=Cohaesibacter celericrescens TaxID=2067669 RepID=A0A2N5XTB9_9HYPH|nr:DUF2497 domain-containing protein [Cohaesibacter celericrescens]PLW77668.1 DUF2497 domain-containing protein [Cohaesibacter celericrescens]
MSNSSAAQEPSMEEILASIRRIISDEEAAIGDEPAPAEEAMPDGNAELSQDDLDALFDTPAPAPVEEEPVEDDMAAAMAEMEAQESEPEPEPEEDVLDLQSEWQEAELVEPRDDDLVFAEEAKQPEPAPEPVAAIQEALHRTLEEQVPPILKASIETTPTPDGPLPEVNRGARLVSDSTSDVVTNAFGDLTHTILSQNTRTMENVVEDMLRPMLKAWLDQNLPIMVERLVRAEIERVSRGEQHYR